MLLSIQSRAAVFLIASLMAVAVAPLPVSLYAEEPDEYTIRAATSEVRLTFAASDRRGHIVKTLNAADVAVADNGSIIRHFRSFRLASETPLDLVILIDASASVATQITGEIDAVKDFVEHSTWGERDSVSILSFGGLGPELICARNCNAKNATVKLSALRAEGFTPLYDALWESTEMLKQTHNAQSRQAMILFSDGIDTISLHSIPDALEAAQNLQSAIYSVNSRPRKYAPGAGDDVLDYLAAETGGISFPPGQNVAAVLRMVLDDLHSGYVLTYDLPEQRADQHSVRILPTSDPRLQFRSRQAYNAAAIE